MSDDGGSRPFSSTDGVHIEERLSRIHAPGDLVATLSAFDVSIGILERVHHCGVSWDFVRRLCRAGAIQEAEDVHALVTFTNMGLNEDDISEWAALGNLNAAVRLHLLNVPLSLVHGFPLTSEHGLDALLRLLQTTKNTGIHVDDLLLWHTAGVVRLTYPHLDADLWAQWRSAAVHHLGMRAAALAAAAGLSVAEAVDLRARGEFDERSLRMLSALRAGA